MEERPVTDRWFEWVTHGRDAGSDALRRRTVELLLPIRDRILDAADLRRGDVVLDVGTGDGIIGVGALDRVAPEGRVILTDVSAPLLDTAKAAVEASGMAAYARFLRTAAETLEGIDGGSIDAVVLRAVLIYVGDQASAFSAFARVLREGGRLSLSEPVDARFLDSTGERYFGWDVAEVAELAKRVMSVFEDMQPGDDPMLTMGLGRLVALAEDSGFSEVGGTLLVSSSRRGPASQEDITRVMQARANPQVPSTVEAARRALPSHQADVFLTSLRHAMETGRGRMQSATAFLRARR